MTDPLDLEATYAAIRAGGDVAAIRDVAGAASSVGLVAGCDAVVVAGADARSFVQGQCTQDVAGLAVGTAVPALLLSPQGRLDAAVDVAAVGDEELVLLVAPGFGDAVEARLRRFKIRVRAELRREAWKRASLRGRGATVAVAGLAPGTLATEAATWPGASGVDLLGPAAGLPEGVPAGDPLAFAAARIESGEPAMGAELDERTIAQEAGLVERAVSFTKGCYLGQELVARIDSRGGNVPRRLFGVVVPGGEPGAPAVGAGAVLGRDGEPVGEVTSAAWSPGRGATVALGYVKRAAAADGPVEVVPAGGGGAPLAAALVSLPMPPA